MMTFLTPADKQWALQSPYVDPAATKCRIKDWHATRLCEHPAEEMIRRLKRLESDLFNPLECDVPASQKEMFVDPD